MTMVSVPVAAALSLSLCQRTVMNLATITAIVFCFNAAFYPQLDDTFGNDKLERIGESVRVSSTTTVAYKETDYERGNDVTLHRIKVSKSESYPPSYIVTGRIISANTLGPADSVFIFVGRNDALPPKLAAMSNEDGEFKFRLWIQQDAMRDRVSVADDLAGYLYVDGKPLVDERGRLTLVSGKSRRYALDALVTYSNASSTESTEPSANPTGITKP